MLFSTFAAGFLASAGLIIAIGSQNAFVLRQGLMQRHVPHVIAACALGDIVLILFGVAGIGALVAQWPGLMEVMRYGGAAFLTVYGVMAAKRAWQGKGNAMDAENADKQTVQRVLLTCLPLTFLNPHAYLDTLVLLGSLSTQYPDAGRWVFAAGACLASITWFMALGFGSRFLQPLFRSAKAWRVLDAFVAVFMLTLAFLLMSKPLA